MATRKGQLITALNDCGETPADLEAVFYKDQAGEWDYEKDDQPVQRVEFNDLPEREFSDGYGGTNGAPCIAFTKNRVYICIQYDGSEHMTGIPRRPKSVGNDIPWPGG